MKDKFQVLLDEFIRKTLVSFTEEDVSKYLLKKKHPCGIDKIKDYLKNCNNIFIDDKGSFFSRAGLFTSRYFSFTPTKSEIENGYLIFGHRGMPFVDPEYLPNELHFFYCGDLINKSVIEINSYEAFEYFKYYGEEYVPQIIAQDVANSNLDLSETDFNLPQKVNLTVLDFSQIYKDSNFKPGDRIVALVSDWDKGFINIAPFCRKGKNPFEQSSVDKKRDLWEESFEKALTVSLETYGPCGSIEEQLVFAFLLDLDKFSVPFCSSFSEVIEKSKKIEFTSYGVETRLWMKNKEIPAISSQMMNFSMNDQDELNKKNKKIENIFKKLGLIIPEWIIDAFILDNLFNKIDGLNNLVEKIIPDIIVLKNDEYNAIMLHLEKKSAIIRKEYNWFADYHFAELRHDALRLYSALVNVFYEIEYLKVDIAALDQQHLVILTQLSGHLSSMIYSFVQRDFVIEKDYATYESSLEGMTYSFEESSRVIKNDIFEYQKKTFGRNIKKKGEYHG